MHNRELTSKSWVNTKRFLNDGTSKGWETGELSPVALIGWLVTETLLTKGEKKTLSLC